MVSSCIKGVSAEIDKHSQKKSICSGLILIDWIRPICWFVYKVWTFDNILWMEYVKEMQTYLGYILLLFGHKMIDLDMHGAQKHVHM